jgi:spore maturation protein CgeB
MNINRIIFVGDLRESSRSFQRNKEFQSMGYEVVEINIAPPGVSLGNKGSILDRVFFKLGFVRDSLDVNHKLWEQVSIYSPAIIWVEKALSIKRKTIERIKEFNHQNLLLFYSNDNLEKWHNATWNLHASFKHYDTIFTVSGYSKDFYLNKGAKRVVWFDRSYSSKDIFPRPENLSFTRDVIFIGSYEKHRCESILHLCRNGIQVEVWGENWPKIQFTNLRLHQRGVYEEQFLKIMHSAKIVLNFLRKMNHDTTTDRSFEIPASASFMLAENTDEHLRLFEEDKEAVYFSYDEELLEKVRYYLEHEEERKAIALAGRQRCLDSGYSHHDRLKYMLSVVSQEGIS